MTGWDEATGRPAIPGASVAVRLLVVEVGTDEAIASFARPFRFVAPRLLVTEVAGAIRRKVAAGEVRRAQGRAAVAQLPQAIHGDLISLLSDETHVASAFDVAVE